MKPTSLSNSKIWREVQEQMRAEKWGREGWAAEAGARYGKRKAELSAEQWAIFLRQLRGEFPDGFDPSYVVALADRFVFPDEVEKKKNASTWSLHLSVQLKNREGKSFGGLKLGRERRTGIIIQGQLCNTLFWWRVEVGGEVGV